MKKFTMFLLFIFLLQKLSAQTAYSNYPVYNGKDLGLVYSKASSQFKVWSPPAEAAQLLFYKDGGEGIAFKTIDLSKSASGTWSARQTGDLEGTFYTFRVKINGSWNNEVPDPYAKAVGINGKRAMVVDMRSTDPAGWASDKSPAFSKQNLQTDAVIYE